MFHCKVLSEKKYEYLQFNFMLQFLNFLSRLLDLHDFSSFNDNDKKMKSYLWSDYGTRPCPSPERSFQAEGEEQSLWRQNWNYIYKWKC